MPTEFRAGAAPYSFRDLRSGTTSRKAEKGSVPETLPKKMQGEKDIMGNLSLISETRERAEDPEPESGRGRALTSLKIDSGYQLI
ncbi:hypothetical protein Trydic_g3973 [Trypoxylus dichotomus]